MNWDAFQRAALAELGHVLYVPLQAEACATPVVESAAPGGFDAGMLARLAQAVGLSVDALQEHADITAASASLRGDAGAKRALWPRLRALRKLQR